MKTIKILLLSFLAFHVFTVIIVGFSRFKDFDTNNNQINPIGKMVIHKSKSIDYLNSFLKDPVFFYSLFAGTNRGYSFFSPNVSSTKINLSFEGDGKNLELPIISPETKTKFNAASLHFNSNLSNEKERTLFLKSITTSLFNHNPETKKIDVYLNLSKYNDINTYLEKKNIYNEKKILGFTASK